MHFRKGKPKPTIHLKRLLLLCALFNGTGLLICFFLGVLLYIQPLVLLADLETLVLTVVMATGIAASLFFLDRAIFVLEVFIKRPRGRIARPFLYGLAICLTALASCKYSSSKEVRAPGGVRGTLADEATGLRTWYRSLEVGHVKLEMNKELLGHTDIPIGEKFYTINNDVKGLQIRESMVSVGCSLKLTDDQGEVSFSAPDLFRKTGTFRKEDASSLRCLITTGRPMRAGNRYHVQAKFWDKYGEGYIEQKVVIRSIDMP